MSKIGQFGIILTVLFFSDFMQEKFNLPIPSAILGMMLLLLLLIFKVIKLEWVEDIGNLFLDNLSILFIPASVGMIRSLDVFRGNILSLIFIILATTTIVMLVTGLTVQVLEKRKEKDDI